MPAQERTESATPRRREEVRRRGQLARSADVNSAVALLVGVLFLRFWGGNMVGWSLDLLRASFVNLRQPDITTEAALQALLGFALFSGTVLGPVFLVMVIAGIAANVAQVGFLFTFHPLRPDLSRINPFEGFRRLLSTRSLFELVKSIAKLVIVGYVVWRILEGQLTTVLLLPSLPLAVALGLAAGMVFEMATWAAAVLLVLAVLDFGYQRYAFEQQIRMSREEVREELKQTEGNPVIRQRVRQLQRAVAQRRMMAAVPRADVVITNPTHLAVALEYHDGMPAPRVSAKGEGYIAERIKRVAQEHGVPLMENKPLAQALFKACEIGDEIPGQMFAAVAELLAFVYRLRERSEGSRSLEDRDPSASPQDDSLAPAGAPS